MQAFVGSQFSSKDPRIRSLLPRSNGLGFPLYPEFGSGGSTTYRAALITLPALI